MRTWWQWTKWTLSFVVTLLILFAVYIKVVQTRFECIMFSMAALIYVELITQYWIWGVELLSERDHRNDIYFMLSERLDVPLDAETKDAIHVLSEQTAKARTHLLLNGVARWLLWLIIVFNLVKAAFFWPTA